MCPPNTSTLPDGGGDGGPTSESIKIEDLRLQLHGVDLCATGAIIASMDKVEDLWSRAQQHFLVFHMQTNVSFDTPKWLQGVPVYTASLPIGKTLTVQGLIKAMYMVADDLNFDNGKQYIVAAVCACANEAANTEDEDQKAAPAKALQHLASTWAAYLLWPFYAKQDNPIQTSDISQHATPTRDYVDGILHFKESYSSSH
ncbi:hypothetical protein C8Q74DRAFT_1216821 [Fomes fomentarius]|nr:hypothetical protein C8Q74DRAFT_1216821 [Fomes fomentarius]